MHADVAGIVGLIGSGERRLYRAVTFNLCFIRIAREHSVKTLRPGFKGAAVRVRPGSTFGAWPIDGIGKSGISGARRPGECDLPGRHLSIKMLEAGIPMTAAHHSRFPSPGPITFDGGRRAI